MFRMLKKIAIYVLTFSALAALLAFLGLFLMSVEAADRLPIIGDYEPMVVQSGSMEPAMRVGGVVLVNKNIDIRDIAIGDVITFKTPSQDGMLSYTTHRVTDILFENGVQTFETKGDANEDPDSWVVPAESVMGQEVMAVPYIGYFVRYIKTPLGFMIVVVVPAMAVIALELRKVYVDIREREAIDACD